MIYLSVVVSYVSRDVCYLVRIGDLGQGLKEVILFCRLLKSCWVICKKNLLKNIGIMMKLNLYVKSVK